VSASTSATVPELPSKRQTTCCSSSG